MKQVNIVHTQSGSVMPSNTGINTIILTTTQRINMQAIAKTGVKSWTSVDDDFKHACECTLGSAPTCPEGTTISVMYEPWLENPTKEYARIEIKVSDFVSLKSGIDSLISIIPNLKLGWLRVRQMDFHLDLLGYSTEFFRQHLDIRGCEIDVLDDDDHIMVESRPVWFQIIADEEKLKRGIVQTRVHAKYCNGCCPIKKLDDLGKLITDNPYQSFRLSSDDPRIILNKSYLDTMPDLEAELVDSLIGFASDYLV